MSLDGLWYIQSKIDAREEKGLQPIPYSRPETSQPSRDPKIPKPSKKTPISHLKSDDASVMTSSTSSTTNSTMALLKEKMHRSKKDKKDNKKWYASVYQPSTHMKSPQGARLMASSPETDAITIDDRFDTKKEKTTRSSSLRSQSLLGVMDLLD